ncbi:hypothetical protein FAVG1_12752 [Fusarium avenaceum]|nr:hypothetical protein FAVG1_12752 [Fusarium avenaceum]
MGKADSRQEANPYTYTPVTEREIRVLKLDPASRELDPLQGEILVKSLSDLPPSQKPFSPVLTESIDPARYVCFEAISYVWGQASFTERLVTPKGFIRLTASLASILRRLRDHSQPRVYWADGVCINQDNQAEKEIQVPLMGVIYSSATSVLCDICEGNKFDSLLSVMERYWKRNIRKGLDLSYGSSTAFSKEASAKIMGVSLPTEEEANAVEAVEVGDWSKIFLDLISSPWFHRLWIIQEFVLGREVSMIFRSRRIPWGEFWAGIVSYKGVDSPVDGMEFGKPENSNLVRSFNSMCFLRICRLIDPNSSYGREFSKIFRNTMGGVGLSESLLPMALMIGCHKACTVPLDRYFGVLGIVDEESNGKSHGLRVDYTAPMRDITILFWKHALQRKSGGELILMAGIPGQTIGYPSWLRDTSVPNSLGRVWQMGPLGTIWHHAGGDPSTWSVTFSADSPDRMVVQGYLVDHIVKVSAFEPDELFEQEAMTIWLEEAVAFLTCQSQTEECNPGARYPFTGERMHDAAIKAVCDYNMQDTTSPYDKRFDAIIDLGLSLVAIAAAYPTKGRDMMRKIHTVFKDDTDVFKELFLRVFRMRGLYCCKTDREDVACLSYCDQV